MEHGTLKERIYPQFARIGQALASDKRLEILDLLGQAPRHVDAIAQETGTSIANTSQHLQILRAAHLVEVRRQGTRMLYALANERVLALWLALRSVAEASLAEVDQIVRDFRPASADEPLSRDELQRLLRDGRICLLDVRPAVEYEAGHLDGAISLPIEELPQRLHELPSDRLIVAYCRGKYCLLADEAIALLQDHGFDAIRVEGGWPEWRVEKRAVITPAKN